MAQVTEEMFVETADIMRVQEFFMTEDEQHLHYALVMKSGAVAITDAYNSQHPRQYVDSLTEESISVMDAITEFKRDW